MADHPPPAACDICYRQILPVANGDLHDTTTGKLTCYVPEGPDRDLFLGLLRLGESFSEQQVGKRPGKLAQLVLDCARRAGPPYSFKQLLCELDLMAMRRRLFGEHVSPVEKIDHGWQLATIHLPKEGRRQVPFGTLLNHLTAAKKKLKTEFTDTAKP